MARTATGEAMTAIAELALWPTSAEELARLQQALSQLRPPPWRPRGAPAWVAGCFITFERDAPGPGAQGDPAWAGAALTHAGRVTATAAHLDSTSIWSVPPLS